MRWIEGEGGDIDINRRIQGRFRGQMSKTKSK